MERLVLDVSDSCNMKRLLEEPQGRTWKSSRLEFLFMLSGVFMQSTGRSQNHDPISPAEWTFLKFELRIWKVESRV